MIDTWCEFVLLMSSMKSRGIAGGDGYSLKPLLIIVAEATLRDGDRAMLW